MLLADQFYPSIKEVFCLKCASGPKRDDGHPWHFHMGILWRISCFYICIEQKIVQIITYYKQKVVIEGKTINTFVNLCHDFLSLTEHKERGISVLQSNYNYNLVSALKDLITYKAHGCKMGYLLPLKICNNDI